MPAVNPSIPQGKYYVAFGRPDCATHHVNLTTGLIAGCGRVDLVPCTLGTDCADCGRSAAHAAPQEAAAASTSTSASTARAGAGAARAARRARAAPPNRTLADGHELPPSQPVAQGVADHGPLAVPAALAAPAPLHS